MALANNNDVTGRDDWTNDDWTQGWSWDLPAKPLADQLSRRATQVRSRRLHLWMIVLERWSLSRTRR